MQQNLTDSNIKQIDGGEIVDPLLIKAQQDMFIDYIAVGGLLTGESDSVGDSGTPKSNEIKQLTVTSFCEGIGISRDTFYRWKKELPKKIPNFGDLVRARRYELFSLGRETQAYNRLYLIGMTGNGQAAVDALTRLLGHFSNLDLPVQRKVVDAGQNLMELANTARKRKLIEAEFSNAEPTTNT